MKKLPHQYRSLVFAVVMSFSTSLIVSGAITFINAPSLEIFWKKWPLSFLLGWPIVFISILLIAPVVNKLVLLCIEENL